MRHLVFVSLLWAFSFPLIKRHLTGLDPNAVAFARMAMALLVLMPFLRPRRVPKGLAIRLAAIGALQMGVMYIAYIRSYQYLKAHEVALLTIFTPLWITLISSLLTRRLMLRFHLAALLAVAGAAVIVVRPEGYGPVLVGVGLVQIANLAFGAGQILYRRAMAARPDLGCRDVFGYVYLGAAVVTFAAALATYDPARLEITARQGLVLIYLGVVAAGLGFLLWNHGATRVRVGALAAANNLTIPLAVLASMVLFGERADPVRLAIGGMLIVTAMAIHRGRVRPSSIAQPE